MYSSSARAINGSFWAIVGLLMLASWVAAANQSPKNTSLDIRVYAVGSAPQSMLYGGATLGGYGIKFGRHRPVVSWLNYWHNGIAWRKRDIAGLPQAFCLPKERAICWGTRRHIGWVSLKPGVRSLDIVPPLGSRFSVRSLSAGCVAGKMIAISLKSSQPWLAQRKQDYSIALYEAPSGAFLSAVPLGGEPSCLRLQDHLLLAGTIVSTRRKLSRDQFYFKKFALARDGAAYSLKLVSATRCRGPVVAFADGLPVIFRWSQNQVFIGNKPIHVGHAKHAAIISVMGSQKQVFILKGNREYGIAKGPQWRYRGLGKLPPGEILGIGHNVSGFWLAQSGFRITMINWANNVRVAHIRVAGAKAK